MKIIISKNRIEVFRSIRYEECHLYVNDIISEILNAEEWKQFMKIFTSEIEVKNIVNLDELIRNVRLSALVK